MLRWGSILSDETTLQEYVYNDQLHKKQLQNKII